MRMNVLIRISLPLVLIILSAGLTGCAGPIGDVLVLYVLTPVWIPTSKTNTQDLGRRTISESWISAA